MCKKKQQIYKKDEKNRIEKINKKKKKQHKKL